MQKVITTIKRILEVAWIGLITDYKAEKPVKYNAEDGYEKQRVVYVARTLMRKEE